LQLQNNSTLGVDLNQEAYSFMHYTSKFKKWLFSFGGDILTSTLITTVETNLRTKFKHYA